jgi:hypothetical protein
MSFDFAGIGKAFCQQYYGCFSSDRTQLRGVYRPTSLVTWAGEQIMGDEGIIAKFASLPLTGTHFHPEDIDCQPTATNGIIIVTNGEVQLQGERHSLRFNDVVLLSQDQAGQWYVANQVFRVLGGGHQ